MRQSSGLIAKMVRMMDCMLKLNVKYRNIGNKFVCTHRRPVDLLIKSDMMAIVGTVVLVDVCMCVCDLLSFLCVAGL